MIIKSGDKFAHSDSIMSRKQAVSTNKGTSDSISTPIKDFGSDVQSNTRDIKQTSFRSNVADIREDLRAIEGDVKQLASDLSKGAQIVYDNAADSVDITKSFAVDTISNVKDIVILKSSKLANQASQVAKNTLHSATDNAADLLDSAKNTIQETTLPITSFVSSAAQNFVTLPSKALQAISNLIKFLLIGFIEFILGTATSVYNAIRSLGSSSVDTATNATGFVFGVGMVAYEIAQGAANFVMTAVRGSNRKLKDLIQRSNNFISPVKTTSNMIDGAINLSGNIAHRITSGATKIANGVGNAAVAGALFPFRFFAQIREKAAYPFNKYNNTSTCLHRKSEKKSKKHSNGTQQPTKEFQSKSAQPTYPSIKPPSHSSFSSYETSKSHDNTIRTSRKSSRSREKNVKHHSQQQQQQQQKHQEQEQVQHQQQSDFDTIGKHPKPFHIHPRSIMGHLCSTRASNTAAASPVSQTSPRGEPADERRTHVTEKEAQKSDISHFGNLMDFIGNVNSRIDSSMGSQGDNVGNKNSMEHNETKLNTKNQDENTKSLSTDANPKGTGDTNAEGETPSSESMEEGHQGCPKMPESTPVSLLSEKKNSTSEKNSLS